MRIKFLTIFLFAFYCVNAQNYADILKISYGNKFAQQFEDTTAKSSINDLNIGFTYPLVLNDKRIFIAGVDFSRHSLKLFPSESNTALYSTTLKLGFNFKHGAKWSGTYVLLPKLASDYKNLGSNDFQLGGFALFKYSKNENLIYKFGLYGSTENFGMYLSPFLGLYYLNPGKKLEINLSLPVNGDINYQLLDWLNWGVDFSAFTGSYNLSGNNTKIMYTQRNSQEYSTYMQLNMLKKSILLQIKMVYAINEFQVYNENDKLDLGFSAFEFGKERNMLNPALENGLAIKVGLIYRFHVKE